MTSPNDSESHILLHPPTADTLVHARSHVTNLADKAPHSMMRIIVKAEATTPNMPDTAAGTLLRSNSLAKIGSTTPAPLTVLPEGAVLMMARMQSEGGCYVRA
jgi:uncharacterized protein